MSDFVISADLGKSGDFTAVAVLRRTLQVDANGMPVRNHRRVLTYRLLVSHMIRFELGSPYTAQVAAIAALARRPELGGRPRLAVDATGVGAAVVDMFLNELRKDIDIHPITITAGDAITPYYWSPGVKAYRVAKGQLVSSVQAALGTERLKVAKGVDQGETLKKELLSFNVDVTPAANEVFSARVGTHDDLVLAVAMGAWLSQRKEIWYCPGDGDEGSAALRREREAEQKKFDALREAEHDMHQYNWFNADDPRGWNTFF
jgi:hypothetical protein